MGYAASSGAVLAAGGLLVWRGHLGIDSGLTCTCDSSIAGTSLHWPGKADQTQERDRIWGTPVLPILASPRPNPPALIVGLLLPHSTLPHPLPLWHIYLLWQVSAPAGVCLVTMAVGSGLLTHTPGLHAVTKQFPAFLQQCGICVLPAEGSITCFSKHWGHLLTTYSKTMIGTWMSNQVSIACPCLFGGGIHCPFRLYCLWSCLIWCQSIDVLYWVP